MKRFLAFMLGVIFGVVFLLGAVGLAAYSSVTVVHPNEIYADIETYLGDLGDVSLLQAYYNILDLYENQTGNLTNEKLYSVGDFLAANHISTTTEEGQTMAFGIIMPQELLDAPLFEYFNTNVDENGHTGVQRALKQIKLSSVPAIVNTFATSSEGGEPVVSDAVVAELDNHSVFDLVYGQTPEGETPDIVANLSVIMENITLADLIPAFRTNDDTDNIVKNLLLALGEAPIGPLITDLTGDENILGSLNEDGSLAAVGRLTLVDILGDNDPLISSLLGNVSVADFVNEQGDFAVVEAMNSISIAGLFGLTTRYAQVEIDKANVTSYYETNDDDTRGALIWSVGTVDGKHYISLNAENDAVETTWIEGQLVCTDTHEHTANCFDYLWYTPCKVEHEHTDEYTVDVNGVATAYVPVETTSVFYTIAGLKLSSLFDDTGAINLDNLIAQLDEHSLDAIIDELLADNKVLEQISELLELDDINLSDLLAEGGIDTLLSKVTDAPIARILEVFEIEGLDIVTDIVGDMSINQLIDGGYNNLTLGKILGYKRYQNFDTIDEESDVTFKDEQDNVVGYVATANNQTVLSTDGQEWFNGKLVCDEEHEHTFVCYDFLWYAVCPDGCVEDHQHVTIDEKPHTKTTGIFSLLVDLTIGDITNNPNSLIDKVFETKLGELLDDELDGLMETIADYSIKELMDPSTLNGVGLGDILNYARNDITEQITTANGWDVDVAENGDGVVVVKQNSTTLQYAYFDVENGKWYAGQMHCKKDVHTHVEPNCGTTDSWTCDKDEHAHDVDCYGYIWYAECDNTDSDEHDEHITIDNKTYGNVDGVFAVLADLTVGDLTGGTNIMDRLTNRLTLGDIFGENIPEMLESLKDKPIANLSKAIETTKVGDLLGFEYNENTKQWEKEVDGQMQPLTGIEKILAEKTINDLKDFKSILEEEITLGDVLDPVPDMLESLAGEKISNLESALNKIYVGEFLGYEQGDKILVCESTDTNHQHNDDLTAEDCCYQKKSVCDDASHTDATHTDECYIYCYEWTNDGAVVEGIMAKIANERLDTLSDLGETIKTFTLSDVMGDDVPSMLKGIADTPIGELDTALDSLCLGEILEYTKHPAEDATVADCTTIVVDGEVVVKTNADNSVYIIFDDGVWYDAVVSCATADCAHTLADCYGYLWYDGETAATGITAKLANKKVGNLGSLGDDIETFTFAEIMGKNDDDNAIIKELYDTKVGDIGSKMDTMMLGTAIGYYRKPVCDLSHSHVDGCYEVIDGKFVWYTNAAWTTKVGAPQSAFVNSTLQDIGNDIDDIKLGELVEMDENSSSMLKALEDTPINGMATAIDGMALGTSMGFVRREMDDTSYTATIATDAVKSDGTNFVKKYDEVWCEATTSCQDSHDHTADCFDYVWYEKCKLDEHIHVEPTCGTKSAWTCEIEEHSHATDVVIDGTNHKKVGGLNAKMSNLTVGNMSGQAVVDIVTELSMRDMIDSGILNFSEEEKFKLAILFGCDVTDHKVTYMFTDFQCDLAGYFAYNATMTSTNQATLTTEQFYRKAHSIADGASLTDEQLAHRDVWQDCTLTEFIEALLAGI